MPDYFTIEHEVEMAFKSSLFFVYILMDFPNDSERSWDMSHHFDSTV